ncbi:phospholysine phosphohistidine inorganic pyrophosphate phosphatase isoform X2 [Pan paniscus]|uniref:phospholysine phosphohistidine inorganic pyrophosphate phosphatase isoform X2 n=1 Tax=Pan paniscus TaxID=9597 RepID=UPI0015607BA5|nr:phospholysine phosphohistidine inorganic pyrophosphate phosphatase isoform X1 [Pan paniscus]
MAPWGKRLAGVRGVLLDISGVLYDSGAGGGTAIAGSVEAVARLKRSRLKVRFCTNESQKSRAELVGQLRRLGFDISEGEVTSPAPAACQILKERGLRPYLLIHDGVRSEFDQIDTSNPNCVVIADAGESFSYQNMNNAFQVLMELEKPVLISLGKGRYYKETSGLMLDVGPYMKALEYACGIKAEVVGKPSPEFFKSALQAIGVEAHQKGVSVHLPHLLRIQMLVSPHPYQHHDFWLFFFLKWSLSFAVSLVPYEGVRPQWQSLSIALSPGLCGSLDSFGAWIQGSS